MDGTKSPTPDSTLQRAGHRNRTARIVDEVIDSRELLGTQGKVVIEHQSMKYELRLTRQGKLILTK